MLTTTNLSAILKKWQRKKARGLERGSLFKNSRIKAIAGLMLAGFLNIAFAQQNKICSAWPSWFQGVCLRLHQVWEEGNNELYFSGYAWHNRYTYPKEKINSYNELAWGGGLGKGLYDEEGDWHGLYAIAFLDSHSNVEPALGYAFLKVAHLNQHTRIGAGYTILVTARPDINHNIPFPGILPWVSVNYQNLTLSATYIPGSNRAGNVLFVLGKWTFDFLG